VSARKSRPIVLSAERLEAEVQSSAHQLSMTAKSGNELLGGFRRVR
jgi:hypothetical protein